MTITVMIASLKHSCLHFRKGTEILQDVVHIVHFVFIMFSAKYMGFWCSGSSPHFSGRNLILDLAQTQVINTICPELVAPICYYIFKHSL